MDGIYVIQNLGNCYDNLFISLAVIGITAWSTFWFYVSEYEV
ncbi:hypothetical protein [Methanococcus vannielii]|nr:hypothetical protein [Methanococcus vannielii]